MRCQRHSLPDERAENGRVSTTTKAFSSYVFWRAITPPNKGEGKQCKNLSTVLYLSFSLGLIKVLIDRHEWPKNTIFTLGSPNAIKNAERKIPTTALSNQSSIIIYTLPNASIENGASRQKSKQEKKKQKQEKRKEKKRTKCVRVSLLRSASSSWPLLSSRFVLNWMFSSFRLRSFAFFFFYYTSKYKKTCLYLFLCFLFVCTSKELKLS